MPLMAAFLYGRIETPRGIITPKMKYERSVFVPDLHVPFVDTKAFYTAVAFIKYFKPHLLFDLGDAIDFYQLSRFSKDPARREALQKDLDQTTDCLSELRKAAPRARFYFIRGNHEYRLTKYSGLTHLSLKASEV